MTKKSMKRFVAEFLPILGLVFWAAVSPLDARAQTAAGIQTTALTPVANLDHKDAEAWFDGFVPTALKAQDIAGAVVVVVKDGKILLSKGYGYSNAADRTPVNPDQTLFRPGSISKLFTWTAIMQLVEQGKIGLDTDINTYLDFEVPGRDGLPITVRHLLTHRAGFEEGIKHLILFKQQPGLNARTFLTRWTPGRIYKPGEVPAYSNYGAGLAGYIVERVSGMPFETYVERNIFAPLAMMHATFRQPLPEAMQPFMSQAYLNAADPAKGFGILRFQPQAR
jgi:CubicO group peptidase (beta-lactamase class C family)